MDHLPLPTNPCLTPVVVEYVCLEPYDNDPALGYPRRHGWEVLYSPYGIRYLHNGEKPEPPVLRSFLQNWLYFGLLNEAFGHNMDIEDFITTNEQGVQIITTAPLNDALVVMCSELESLKGLPKQVQDASTAALWAVLEHTWRVSLHSITPYKKGVVSEQFWVSLAVLAESIESALYGVFMDGNTNLYRMVGNPSVGAFMVEEMRVNGWCPFDVKRIDCTTGMVSMLYYISNLPPPRKHLKHDRCTEDLCVWMSIGSDYQTRHIQQECACEGFKNVGKVIEVLKGEGLPLIQRQGRDGDTGQTFHIVDSGSVGDFVAISHVWAEGLGNPHRNALPTCSLAWVQDLVNALPGTATVGSTPFWCDTICVPILPVAMHTIAMMRLRRPYQEASKVLVLDSYLYTKKSREMSALEIWFSVVVCSWSQRLWTFQESRLAKDVWFQFADQAVNLGQVYFSDTTDLAQEVLVQAAFLAYRGHIVVPSDDPNFPRVPSVRIMREALRGRAVSVASDEALCIFANMFMDMEPVTQASPEERMPLFWRTTKQVPIGIVFSSATKKLTLPGLHWAPASFMGDLETPHWLIEHWPPTVGHYTPRGLRMPVGGFIFSDEMLIWDDSFDTIFTDAECPLRDEKGDWYWLKLGKPWNQSRTDFPGAGEQLCILMHQVIPEEVAGDDSFAFAPGVQGVIGTVEYDEPDTPPRFKGYRHVALHRHPQALQELHRSVYRFVEGYVEAVCARQDRERAIASGDIAADEDEDEGEEEGEEEDEDEDENEDINATVKAMRKDVERDGNGAIPTMANGAAGAQTQRHTTEAESQDITQPTEIIQREIANLEIGGRHDGNDETGPSVETEGLVQHSDDNHEEDSGHESSETESEGIMEDDQEEAEEEKYETPDTFKITDARRIEVQEWADSFARSHEPTRRLAVAHGRVTGRDEDGAIEQYTFHCRFQLQMRKRNRMQSFPKNAVWYID